ncbi:MAG: HEAT repeat domain-containing protein [Planctomycetes bacterium]|nr:HEAT repeat domain-containing protein [Planctomycetota bacterium]
MRPYHPIAATFSLCLPLLAQQPHTATDLAEHYERVERELRAAPSPADPALAAARTRAIDLLREYRLRADFGQNTRFPGQRMPFFVDDDGRRCAVAYLLDRTGAAPITEAIAREQNHAWVADLAPRQQLADWLARHGLGVEEAARIQGPGIPPPQRPEPPPPPAPWEGPRDAGTGPRTTGTSPRPTGTGTAGVAAAAAPRSASPVRGLVIDQIESVTWSQWWAWNRAAFFAPRRLVSESTTTRARDPEELAVITTLRANLTAEQPQIRAAAALAAGRIGGQVGALRLLLRDPSLSVRMATVLGLGADRSPAARHALLSLWTDAELRELQPYGLLALAANTPAGATADARALARQALDGSEGNGAAAAVLARTDADPALRTLLLPRLTEPANAVTAARLIEALAVDADAALVAELTRGVSGRLPDVRRSAALALGRSHHALALPALLTAFELEHELTTATMLLLAIGDHGGDAAGPFLLEQVERGRKPLRAFAALALGLFGRDRHDAALATAVRDAAQQEANRDLDGAWLLASGLLRDSAALPRLAQQLQHGSTSTARGAAAHALALVDDPGIRPSLRAAMQDDNCPFVRAAAAEAYGMLGTDTDDVIALGSIARRDRDPAVRIAAAQALGAVATEAARSELLALSIDDDMHVRVGAIDGLGRLARGHDELVSAALTRQANFTLWPSWLQAPLRLEF